MKISIKNKNKIWTLLFVFIIAIRTTGSITMAQVYDPSTLSTSSTNNSAGIMDNPMLNWAPEPSNGTVNLTNNPLLDWAPESPDSNIPKATVVEEIGAGNATANKSSTGATNSSQPVNTSMQNAGSCMGGKMLAKLLTSSISSAIGGKGSSAASKTESMTNVPTTWGNTQAGKNQEATTNANTGMFLFGVQTGVSWDSIAYCIVNTIIDYIVNSTIAWANSGFKGNPAFIRNPEQFFKNLADQTAAQFIREVAYNTTNIDVCRPFRVVIATGLAGSYSGLSRPGANQSCSLSQMQQSMMQSGRYTITTPTDWIALTKPENNVYYSYISAGEELGKRIDVRNNTARFDLTINRGFLSQKKCKDDSKPESKSNPCDTITPGSVIADSLSQTLNIPKQRLVSAQKFDQMVDAIVNNLIKIALSKVLESATGQAASEPTVSDYYTQVGNTPYYDNSYGYNGGVFGTPGTGGGTFANNSLVVQNPDGTYSLSTNRLALDTDGVDNPGVDPTTHQSQTSYGHGLSTYDNYVVVPDNSPIALGTAVIITNSNTGQQVLAIVGDHGGSQGHGEVSIGVAKALNIYPGGDAINSAPLQFRYTNQPMDSIPRGR